MLQWNSIIKISEQSIQNLDTAKTDVNSSVEQTNVLLEDEVDLIDFEE